MTTVFGQWRGVLRGSVYVIDDEIDHGGQGYVYLRAMELSRLSSSGSETRVS
jgi:hypothetical protein